MIAYLFSFVPFRMIEERGRTENIMAERRQLFAEMSKDFGCTVLLGWEGHTEYLLSSIQINMFLSLGNIWALFLLV